MLSDDTNSQSFYGNQYLEAYTTNPSAPSTPNVPTAEHVDSSYAVVQAEYPIKTGGVPIDRLYFLAQSFAKKQPPQLMKNIISVNGNVSIYGLNASTKYYISCFAVNTAGFQSPTSLPLVITTGPLKPPAVCSPPTIVNVTGKYE